MADIKKIKIGETTYDIKDATVGSQITDAINALDVTNAGNVSAADASNKVTLKNINETDGIVGVNTTNSATVYNAAGTDGLIQGAKDYAKDYADGLISGLGTVLKFKGTVADETALKAIKGAKKGDVYVVTADSSEWVATADAASSTATTTWEKFGTTDVKNALYKDTNAFTDDYILKADGTAGKVKAVEANAGAVGLGNVTNNKQVKGLSSGTTSGHIVTWGADGYTVADGGVLGSAAHAATTDFDAAGAASTAEQNAKDYADAKTRTISSGLKADGSTEIVSTASANKLTLADSGVTAGEYGPTSNQTPAYGATFNVPDIKVNAKGVVTSVVNRTVQIPASDNTNTAHSHSAGVGLVGSGTAGVSGTYTYKAALASETLDTNAAVSRPSADANRIYPVIPDKNGKLAAIVPWTDGSAGSLEEAKQYADTQDALQYAVSNGDHTHTVTAKAPVYKVNPTTKYMKATATGGAVTLAGNTELVKDVLLHTKNLVTGSIAANGMVTGVTTASKTCYTASYDSTNHCLDLTAVTFDAVASVSKNASAITYATGAVDINGHGDAVGTEVTPDKTGSVTVGTFTQPTVALSATSTSTDGPAFVQSVGNTAVAYEDCTDITVSTTGAHEHTINKRSAQ